MASPTNERRLKDALLISNSAVLPNAANTIYTNVIDLQVTLPYPIQEHIVAQLATTVSTGANSKNINVTLQHSADTNTSNFVNIPTLKVYAIAGNATNFPATTVNYSLPVDTKRYIRALALGEANGGDASDGTLTINLLF